jgi:hypothetical protein
MPARPDLVAAFISRTSQLSGTVALAGTRISGRLRVRSSTDPSGWQMPTYAIVWRKVPGPVGSRGGTMPVARVPMQYECYGSDLRTADLLARTLLGELFPDPPAPQGFKAAGCAVFDMEEMGAAAPLMESETAFPRVVGTLFVRYLERPS